MRSLVRSGAAGVAALLVSAAAHADEQEILAHYDAYEAAMAQLRYDVAEAEAEAAWRAAEAEWGGVEDTAVLVFNLVRLRLMADLRAQAIEPAQRLAELADTGAAGASVRPEEAALFLTLAEYDAADASRGEIRDLEQALEAFPTGDFAHTRIAQLGWSYAANSRMLRDQYRDALSDAERAGALLAADRTAPVALASTVALIGARSGYETSKIPEGILAAQRGIAAFPVQPAGQPLDPQLATLLLWKQGLEQLHLGSEGRPYASPDPALDNPVWDDERYASSAGCTLTWAEQPFPAPSFGGPRATTIGAVFEFRLDAQGGVTDITAVGSEPGEEEPFAETLRGWRAEPPASPECQGPWHIASAFLFPRD